MEKIDTQVVVLLPAKVKKQLVASAKANGRSLSGEARFILTNGLSKVQVRR